VLLHWIGGLASGSFYVPYKGVKKWSWETYWLAGYTKEKEMPEAQKLTAIKEFSFKKGVLVATFRGIMSACFAFALQAGKRISEVSEAAGTAKIWSGLPALPVLLLGGFTTNFIWCAYLNIRNRSGYQYLASTVRAEHAHHGGPGGGEHGLVAATAASGAGLDLKIPVMSNYIFSTRIDLQHAFGLTQEAHSFGTGNGVCATRTTALPTASLLMRGPEPP
jgi:hypothetical protein